MARGRVTVEPSSFRDPSGQVFYRNGRVLRQVNKKFAPDFEELINSGLYRKLTADGFLLPFKKLSKSFALNKQAAYIIETKKIPFISYPYEWSFSQLKDAALLTLRIQQTALKYNMTLRDGSAYNIQFLEGRPILIDSLSFGRYKEGEPWVAYRQFCQHFLAPLALMSFKDVRLNRLAQLYLDGIPLDLASSLLPLKTWVAHSLLTHLHLHRVSQKRFAGSGENFKKYKIKISQQNLLAIVDSLQGTVAGLTLKMKRSAWSDYYSTNTYSERSFLTKKKIVAAFLKQIPSRMVWDLGANTGEFSRLASSMGIETIAFDIDPLTVEKNYLTVKKNQEKHLLPLLTDLANPSPALGWENRERQSLIARGPADCVLMLALLHHLAIANNLPFDRIAAFASQIGSHLIIESIPKEDLQVQRLLATREDIFDRYDRQSFELAFQKYFKIIKKEKITQSHRLIYLMKKL